MKKKPVLFFKPHDGSGLLALSWTKVPFGEGLEAEEGFGVGFFAHNGDLLSVQFFDVEEKEDKQTLTLENEYSIFIKVKKGLLTDIKITSAKKAA